MRPILRLGLAFSAILLTNLIVVAQTPTGSVSGNVADTTGAPVADATVRIINSATRETHTTNTNASGAYLFPIVPVGSYTLEAESPGFRTEKRVGVTLNVNQNARADFTLQVGSVKEGGIR